MKLNEVHLLSGLYCYKTAGELKESLYFASHESESPSHMHSSHSNNLNVNETGRFWSFPHHVDEMIHCVIRMAEMIFV